MTSETTTQEAGHGTQRKVLIPWKMVWKGIVDLIVHAVGQIRIWKNVYGGFMHFLIFWGVSIQVVGTAINIQQMALFTPWALTWPRESFYLFYEFMMDLGGLFILVGVTLALIRRLALKPSYLGTKWDDYYVLVMFLLLSIVGFFNESMRLITAAPTWRTWSFLGNLLSRGLEGIGVSPGLAFRLQPVFLFIHIGLAITLTASLPFTKLRHLVLAPLYLVLRPHRNIGALGKIDNIEETDVLGATKIDEFASNQLLSFDACLDCGRCEEVCPATIAGMEYSPRTLIQSLRGFFAEELISSNTQGQTEIQEDSVGEDLWACTTCGACLHSLSSLDRSARTSC